MPKSKKNKVVHLTQVKKKGKDHKEDLLKQLEQYVAKFKNVYIFDFDQMKSDRIMNLRIKLKDIGRIYSGKNSLVSSIFKTIGSRTKTDYDELLKQVAGHKGLLFSDIKSNKLMELVDKEAPEFCKKLIGYSQIAPETKSMLVDDVSKPVDSSLNEKADNNESNTKKKQQRSSSKKKATITTTTTTNSTVSEKREVKFVKI